MNDDATMTFIDAGVPTGDVVQVQYDLQPQLCPNQLTPITSPPGVVRAAIVGTEHFDVTEIDRRTLEMEELSPNRSFLKDVATARRIR